MAIKVDGVVEQHNYATKVVNAYIVYELDSSPNSFIPFNNITIKNACLEQLIE